MKKERKGAVVYIRFAIFIVVCAALGAAAGFFAAMAGENLPESAADLAGALTALGTWWFVPGYVLLVACTVCYLRGKALLPQAEAEDAAFREADRRLCLALIFSGASMVWLFIALAMSVLELMSGEDSLLILPCTVVQLVWTTTAQAVIIKAAKVIHPEKRGNVFDTGFQKDWYNSCDEAERQQIGQCSYFSFRVMSTLFPLAMLLLILLAVGGVAQPGWILLVGGLWMAQQVSYQCMDYHLDHGKEKNGR